MKLTLIFMITLTLTACGAKAPGAADEVAAGGASASSSGAGTITEQAAEAGIKVTPGARNKNGRAENRPRLFRAAAGQIFHARRLRPGDRQKLRQGPRRVFKTFLETEDTANGYLKTSCDGGQSCLTMALFKRPDGSYLVAVNTSFEMGDDYYFLDYDGGKWTDVSAQIVPEFSKRKMYELPRVGTTVKVFAKKIIEEGADFMASEKGAALYDLVWKDGKFTIVK